MTRDLRIAFRSLVQRPGFAAAVVLTLALGLGANAALFSLVDAVILRPLPYPEPDRLVSVVETVRRGDSQEERSLSYPDFEAIRDGAPAFEAVAAWSGSSFVVTGGERAVLLRGARVSADYFDVLGVTPQRGRMFTSLERAEDERTGESSDQASVANEVVIGHALWQTTFGGDDEILGRTLSLGGEPYEIVGVMPKGFGGVREDREVWASLDAMDPSSLERGNRFLGAVGRLADGQSLEQANTQLGAIFARLEQEFPEDNIGYGALARSLHESMVGDLRGPVTLLLAAVGLLLLIACANVANLLLVHRLRQRRQAAIRLALGAGVGDLVRWSVVEVAVLGLAGGALGLLFASWCLTALLRISPVVLPTYAAVAVDGRAAFFALVLALVVAAVLGVLTALQIRSETAPALLRAGAAADSTTHDGVRRGLLAAEVALALLVSVGALATLASWRSLNSIDPGFDGGSGEAGAAVFSVFLPDIGTVDEEPGVEDPGLAALREQVRTAAASLPGVAAASLSSDVPLQGGYSAWVVSAEGSVPRPDEPYGGGVRTYRHVVSPEYFRAVGVPVVHGRGFEDVRSGGTPVAIVSRRLAERLWPDVADPVGKRFKLGAPPSQEDLAAIEEDPKRSPWIEVAGLVGEVRHRNLVPDPERVSEDPDLYLPLAQWPRRSLSGVVRMESGDAAQALAGLRSRLEEVHADMPVFGLGTLAENLEQQTARSRFGTLLMSLFAALSLGLAAVGIYAVMAYRVGERTREIGIRMALGADRHRVVRGVLREGLAVTAAGLAVGAVAVFALVRWLAGSPLAEILHDSNPGDPALVGLAAALLLGVSLVACLLPARKASRVDPMVALRDD